MDDFDIMKKLEMNKNTSKELEHLKENTLLLKNRQSRVQLSDEKKKNNGFLTMESVIDIGQHEYGVSDGSDVLYTYGIEPCCGVVVYDSKHSILLHLDGSDIPEQVIELTDSLGFSSNSRVIVAPGITCGMMPGSFDYSSLESLYRNRGFDVTEHRIPSTLGFITVDNNNITIGTAADRSLDEVFHLTNENLYNK